MERTNTTINKEWEGELDEGALQVVTGGQIGTVGDEARTTARAAGDELRETARTGGEETRATLVIVADLTTTLTGGSVL